MRIDKYVRARKQANQSILKSNIAEVTRKFLVTFTKCAYNKDETQSS